MSQASDLESLRDSYIAALTADALSGPQPAYSWLGESVDRDKWRTTLLAEVEHLNKLIPMIDPFEIRSIGV